MLWAKVVPEACTDRRFSAASHCSSWQQLCPERVRVPRPQACAGRRQLCCFIGMVWGLISGFRSSWKQEFVRLLVDIWYVRSNLCFPFPFLSQICGVSYSRGTPHIPPPRGTASCAPFGSSGVCGRRFAGSWRARTSGEGIEATRLSGARQIVPSNPLAVVCSICQGLHWSAPFHQRYH